MAAAALGYHAFALGLLVAIGLGSFGHGDFVVAGFFALVGPIFACWWKPRLLFRVACVVQGLICLFFGFFGFAFNAYLSASALAVACISYFLACAGVRPRVFTVVGGIALAAAVLHNAWDQGTDLSNGLPLAIVGLCIMGMSYLLPGLQTKQSIGSTPSSGVAS